MATVGSQSTIRAYRFGPYEVELDGELRKFGTRIRLEKKPLQLLLFLLEHRGRIVTRSAIHQYLWPDVHVDFERNLNIAIKKVRDALCDSADAPIYVETITGQGYRFIATVEVVPHLNPAATLTPEAAVCHEPLTTSPRIPPEQRASRSFLWVGFCVVLAVGLGVGWAGWQRHRTHLAFKPHDYVLITNFENHTGDKSLDGALETALVRELSNSQYVAVAPPERIGDVLRLMGKLPDAHVDTTVGREICLRDGEIKAMLSGGLQKIGNRYDITVFVVNPVTELTVATFDEKAQDESKLLDAVHRVADAVRNRLGEDIAAIQLSGEKLQRVTTPSLAALQLYSLAAIDSKKMGPENQTKAEQLLRQAIARDPQFASALMLLAYSMFNQRRPRSEWVPYAEQALKLADQQTDREAQFIKGCYAMIVQMDSAAATAQFKALSEAFPDDFWSAWLTFTLLMSNGRENEGRLWSVRLADLRPNDLNMNAWAWVNEASVGSPDAERFAARINSLVAKGAKLGWGPEISFRWASVVDRLNREDVTAALAEAQRLVQSPDATPTDRGYLANIYLSIGRLRDAESMADPQAAWTVGHSYVQILIAWERGDRAAIRDLLVRNNRPPEAAIYSGLGPINLARAGYLKEAQKLAALFEENGELMMGQEWVKGELALAEGRTTEAIPPLRYVVEHFSIVRQGHALFSAAEGLARALDKSGDLPGAIKALEPLENDHRFDYLSGIGPTRQRFYLAQLYRKAGRFTEARKIESELLKLLSTADTDYPLAIELKKQAAH